MVARQRVGLPRLQNRRHDMGQWPHARSSTPLSLHPHPLVRAQMPVLRFQFASATGSDSGRRLRRRADRRPRTGPAPGLGPFGAQCLLRRRYTQPVPARRHRRHPVGLRGAPALRARSRNHDGMQSGHGRTRPFRGLSRRRRQSHQLRHPEFRRRLPAAPGPHPRFGGSRARGEVGPGRRHRQPQPRPDVCVAAANAGDGVARCRESHRAATRPSVALPAHAGAEHGLRGATAARHSGRRRGLGHAGALHRGHGRRRPCAVRDFRLCASRPSMRAQPQLPATTSA